jgi:hypothetical protein
MKELFFKTRDDFKAYLEDEKYEMYSLIVTAIDFAYLNSSDSAEIVTFYIEDEDLYIDLISMHSEWKESLTLALNFYESIELYEKCARIKYLIDSI